MALGESAGLIPRCLIAAFDSLGKREQHSFRARCSFVQIYNEVVYDLLQPAGETLKGKLECDPSQGLRMRYNNVDGFYVENLAVFECGTAEEALEHFQHGVQYKQMGSHKLNEKSSRSHCLFTLYLESNDAETNTSSCSKLTLVDLAGSERVSVTGATGQTFIEATHINTSLFVLRTVIANLGESVSLAQQQTHAKASDVTCQHKATSPIRLYVFLRVYSYGVAKWGLHSYMFRIAILN